MKKKIIAFFLAVLILFVESYYTFAATKGELTNQKSELDDKISSTKNQIDQVEENLSGAIKEVQDLASQIATYESAISELNNKIETVSNDITKSENDIAQKEKETNEKQELLNRRLIAIYESGNVSYLDMLLTSSDLSDFLSKYYLISEIAEYDTNLIISLKEAKEELEQAKIKLEEDKKSLENAKQEQVEKQDTLKKIKAEKDSKVASLNSEEKALQDELEQFERDKKKIEADLAEIAKQEEEALRKANGGVIPNLPPSACGYIFPIPGFSKANIATKTFPSYSGHTGVDININVRGKQVVAVKDGTVTKSEAMTGSIPNYGTDGNYVGSYRSFGEYIAINHHDGTMTYYCHLRAGSRMVSVGQEVKQGQVIGYVGNTGNCQPRPSPSNPYAGTHLHFEVHVLRNGSWPVVNPLGYLPG